MFKKFSRDNIDKFKNILCDSNLNNKKIHLRIPIIDININIDDISLVLNVGKYQYESNFIYNDDVYVVEHKDSKFPLFFEVWERTNLRNEYGVNVALSCDCNDFGEITFGRDFYQIDIEDSLEDNEYIYIVRNISMLYKSYKSQLRQEYDSQILSYIDDYFLVITKFKKNYMNDRTKYNEIFIDFLKGFIMCAFVNERFKICM